MMVVDDQPIDEWLPKRLGQRDSGLPRSKMSPALSYGRHRGPYPFDSRHAAVLIAIYKAENGCWTIPLTRRPRSLKHHGGQICLPGGRLEPGESPKEAALREFEEELGVRPQQVVDCGELDTQYVYNSNNRVHPVVAMIDAPERPWRPDPVEVDEVIPLLLSSLLDSEARAVVTKRRSVVNHAKQVGGFEFRASMFRVGQHEIWGATAVILDQLAQVFQAAFASDRLR